MKNVIGPYKGYTAEIEYDPDDQVLLGKLMHVSDVISFEATSTAKLKSAFETAVDDYLEYCSERGRDPERPFSGRCLLRMDPDLHRAAAVAAYHAGQSLNEWICSAVRSSLQPTSRRAGGVRR